jgi:hypothetical protein
VRAVGIPAESFIKQENLMSKAFASIKRGLQQAIRHRKGKRVGGLRLHVPLQISERDREGTAGSLARGGARVRK